MVTNVVCRLDKNLFSDGLENMQARVNERFYVTALSFAQDIGGIISAGITSPPKVEEDAEDGLETLDAAPSKNTFSDIRERRKLGKRILKAIQPFLETALRVESEISNKPYENLQKELEAVIDASIDPGRAAAGADLEKQEGDAEEDTIMVDAPDSSEITVKSAFRGNDSAPADADAMDTAEDGGNIEVNTSRLGIVNDGAADEMELSRRKSKRGAVVNGVESSETPPDSNGYVTLARPNPTGPPTPPQSNGSFGKEPSDSLAEGGILWYLKAMKPEGTSILGEHWAAGRDAVRMLSEELTDLDDEELKGLVADVNGTVKAAVLEAEAPMEAAASTTKSKATSKVKKRRVSARRR